LIYIDSLHKITWKEGVKYGLFKQQYVFA